jgi:hypothetical protein
VQEFTRPLDFSIKMRQTSGKPECGVVSLFPNSKARHSGYGAGVGWWSNQFGTSAGGKFMGNKVIVHKAAWQTVRIYAAADGKVYYYLNGGLERTITDNKLTKGVIRLGNGCADWEYKDIVLKDKKDTGCANPRQVTVDLGAYYSVAGVTIFNYIGEPARKYCGQKLVISASGAFEGEETAVWDPTEKWGPEETADGHTHVFSPQVARHVRYFCAGNNQDQRGTHLISMDIWGLRDKAPNPQWVNIDQLPGVTVDPGPGVMNACPIAPHPLYHR